MQKPPAELAGKDQFQALSPYSPYCKYLKSQMDEAMAFQMLSLWWG